MHIRVPRGIVPTNTSVSLAGVVSLAVLLIPGVAAAQSSNRPPRVTITSPSKNSSFAALATIEVAARATDVDGSIVRVDFYVGGSLVGSDTTSPYGVTWSDVPGGTYSLTAVAQDDTGTRTMSVARAVTVTGSNVTATSNAPPMVSLTSPADGATFSAPATISLSASASDSDGTIASVEFYTGGTTQIGTDTTSPYSTSWNQVAAGTYQVTAVARDNASGMTVSGSRTIFVLDPAMPSRALFTPSADHATNVDYYMIEIFPNGANPNLANAVAAQNIGKPSVVNGECQADVSGMIQSLTPGSYIATVTAIGPGGSTRSAAAPPFTR